MAQSIMNTLYMAIQPSNTQLTLRWISRPSFQLIRKKVWGKHMSTYLCGLHLHDFLPKLEAVILIDDDRAREGHIIIIYSTVHFPLWLQNYSTRALKISALC